MGMDVVVVLGAGGIGTAIVWRQGIGKAILLADWNAAKLAAAAQELVSASYAAVTQSASVSSHKSAEALAMNDICRLAHKRKGAVQP